MNEVVADTHAILWFLNDPARLTLPAQKAMFAGALSTIYVSAITPVELAYLVDKGRFAEGIIDHMIAVMEDPRSGIVLAPITPQIAKAVRRIPRKVVPDMPDRSIAATALHLGFPLVTADSQIRASNVTTIW